MNKKILFIVIAVVLIAALMIFGVSASKEEVEETVETQQPMAAEETSKPVVAEETPEPVKDKSVADNPFLEEEELELAPSDKEETGTESKPTPAATPKPAPAATPKPTPVATPKPTEKPDDASTSQTINPATGSTAYEAYSSMSGQQQMDFMNSFGSMEEFFAWYNNARAEYETLHPSIEIGSDGTIDLSGVVGN